MSSFEPPASTPNTRPTVILAGCGYGAIPSLQTLQGHARVIAINPYPYQVNSGMTTRLLSGRFNSDLVKIPLLDTIQASGAEYVQGRIVQVWPTQNRLEVETDDGDHLVKQYLTYDLMLLNVGRQVATHGIPGIESAFKVRPMDQLIAAKDQIERCWIKAQAGDRSAGLLTFVVVGGGSSGVELVGELYDLCRQSSQTTGIPLHQSRIILVSSHAEIPNDRPARFQQLVKESLQDHGIEILAPMRVTTITPNQITIQPKGDPPPEAIQIPCQTVLWAAGLRVPDWLRSSGLPTGSDGSIRVLPTFQVQGFPDILAMGDCAYFCRTFKEDTGSGSEDSKGSQESSEEWCEGDALPKLGVYAVRSGPVAAQNLLKRLQGQPLDPYIPQKTVFISVTVGNRIAVMQKGWLIGRGYLATCLKNGFDWLYMRRFKAVRWQDFFY